MKILYSATLICAVVCFGIFYKDIKAFVGKTLILDNKPTLIIRVKDSIYHCSSFNKNWCGLHATCGRYTLRCIKDDYEVQLLDNLEPME